MSDLSSLFSTDESRPMVIVDPTTGEPLKNENKKKMTIMMTDNESELVKRVISVFQTTHANREPTYAAKRKLTIDILVAATTGFKNLVLEGKELEYSPEAARKLYEGSPVIRKQADKFVGTDENFLENVLAA